MKTFYSVTLRYVYAIFSITALLVSVLPAAAQNATVAIPIGIGKQCSGGAGDSVKYFNYNAATNILTHRSNCKPSLAAPGFSSSLATITFNPFDQFLYFTQIKATSGIYSSYTYRWAPTACPGSSAPAYKTFINQFVAGVEFDPNTGLGYQFNFVDTTGYPSLSVDATGTVGQFTSGAVVNGNPAMAYFDATNNKLKYVRALDASGQDWATPVTISAANMGQYPSLKIVNGKPAISYYDIANGNLMYIQSTDANGTAWGTAVTVEATNNIGQYTSLVVVNGNPAIAYYDVSNQDLRYVRATDVNGAAWGASIQVAGTGNIGQYASMAIVSGNPAISYYDASNGDLKYVRATDASGTAWGSLLTVESTNDVGQYTSLAVVNGNPAISYYDNSNSDLRYVKASNATGSAWGTPLAVATAGNIGQYTSLVVVNGNPAIAYYDVSNTKQKFVRATDANGTTWGTQYTCENLVASAGQYASLIMVNGNPAVCYYDATNKDAKYVRAYDANGTLWYSATNIFKMELQSVDFATGILGISRPIDFRDGTGTQRYIYQQNGDVVMTPGGKMLACWDNKYMTVNWQDYASAIPLVATYIDSFKFGAAGIDMIGLAYSDGKLVGSVKNKSAVCSSFYNEIDILSGALSPVTYNAGSPFTNSADMTDITSGIGIAKRLVSATENPVGSKTYDIVYEVIIKNYGGTPVTNVQAYDTLTKINPGNLISGSITSFTAPAGINKNILYNGNLVTGLLVPGSTLSNIPGQNTITLQITCRISNINPGIYYYNQAFATATGLFGDALRDASTNGSNPDLNLNSKPDDAGESQPTPLLIQVTPTTAPCVSLTNVLYTQNFGTGTGLATAIPAAVYGTGVTPIADAIAYTGSVAQPILNETYTISDQVNNANTTRFISLTDHTANANGRMLIVNADANNSKIYSANFTKTLCPNQQYSLVFYAAFPGNPSYKTVCDAFGGFTYPQIKMIVKDGATGSIISAISTGNITSNSWQQFGFKFTPPISFSNVIIELVNDAPGGCGNDVVIDDIQFGSCDALPTVTVGTGSAGCMGTSTTFSSALSDPGAILGTVIYQWQVAGALAGPYSDIPGATSSTYNIPSLSVSDIGKYYRLIVAASGNMGNASCQYTSPGILLSGITPSTGPSSVTATGSNICAGTSTTLTAVGASLGTGANYQWGTGSVVGTNPIPGATSSTLTVSPGTTTTYWVQIQNNTAPCAATAGGITKLITVNQPSVAPSSVTGADICGVGSTTLTALGGALGTGANYQWGTGSVVGTSPIVGATSATLTVSPVSTTTYWVQIQNGTAPCSATTSGLTKLINVNQASVAPSSVTGADICGVGSTTLTALGGALGTGANYQWGTGSVVGTSPIVGATGATLTVSPGSTTTYWVQIQNGTAPCSATTSGLTKLITVNQPSVAPSSVTGANICGTSSTTLTATGGALGTGANYQWGTGSVVGTSPIVGATSSTLTVSPGSTTTYWVQIQNNSAPCAATTSGLTKLITVSQPSVAPSSVTGANICAGGTTILTALGGSLGTGANYQWGTGSVVGTSPIVGATSSTLTVSPGSTTTYWVQIQNNSAPCTATTSGLTKVITVDQLSVAATAATKNKNNICPGISVNLGITGGTLGTGASWKWYTGSPGATLVGSGSSLAVTPAVTTTYYVRAEGSCNTTADQSVTVFISCDVDKDKDGIPDYVESNIAAALTNAYNTGYAGYKDNNNDFINDDFQADGDSDNDGIPNYLDTTFPGRVDTNGDGVDDRFDADKDGIINMLDLDSDNDGIPDVVEAYGVDTNGDGKIDGFTDTDGDGLSQNVDANNSGANNSGIGLGSIDFDGDGIPNFIDLDSDNDGIPDVVESGGPDANNNGMIDGFVDVNGDGLHDGYINATALLKTGVDGNADGKADSWPNKNLDQDLRPNAYDMDSDGDGIIDLIEAGFPDIVSPFGVVDGVIGTNGWSGSVSALAALNLRNTDTRGNPDYLDIDSDDDGIPDNIEGQSTAGYKIPVTTDTDGDGLVNTYDNVSGFGGTGILVYDHDGDGIPDYRDLDTDADGVPDVAEGNDFNLNGISDEVLTLTGLDTDGDGLDNRFDSLNSVTNLKGTSYNLGTGGTTSGDATPGSRCTVQKKTPAQLDRDWRFIGTVLPVQVLNFSGIHQNNTVMLSWTIITTKDVERFEIERSLDNSVYVKTGTVTDAVKLNEQQSFGYDDDISGINNEVIYYRLKVIGKSGEIKYSNILVVRSISYKTPVKIMPNPASDYVSVKFFVDKEQDITIRLVDNIGKVVLQHNEKAGKGNNNIQLNNLTRYSSGVYTIQLLVNGEIITKKLILDR